MLLAFDAKQKLKLSVTRNKEYLSKYLLEEERVVGAMLDPNKLEPEGEGMYKYTVTSFKVFQLDVKPVVSIAVENNEGVLKMSALDSTLDGLGMVEDFNLILKVMRDSLMERLESKYPGYFIFKNKGYGTKQHFSSLKKNGLTNLHRKSFLNKLTLI